MTRNLVHSEAIADFRGVIASPGAILLEGNEILAAGSPQEIGASNEIPQRVHALVMPAFANVHTHLDLSGEGIQPASKSFVSWIEHTVTPIRRLSSEGKVQDATKRGIELSIAGGTAMVGDIASTLEVADQVRSSKLDGVSFVEVFGVGNRQDLAIATIESLPDCCGISPHAPYSCSVEVYRRAIASGKPIATHLAETPEEFETALQGTGPLVEYAKKLGVWDESVEKWNSHPIDEIIDMLGEQQLIAAHVNYVEDFQLERIAATNVTVAYCPRASVYFGHKGHRFQEMIDGGISVALGTDSLLCLDTPDRISVLDEMRLLYQTCEIEISTLIAMATVNGAKALGQDPSLLTLETGEVAGLIAIEVGHGDPVKEAMSSTKSPGWIVPLRA